MSFALGGLAVMSGSRPLATMFARLLAAIEVRSVFLGILVFVVVLFLAYLTNPSETSFRAFLTEQSFRLHLSKLDDLDTQDEPSYASQSSPARKEQYSRWGQGKSSKYHYYSDPSSSIAFANRASVSLRTPKHLFRSFGIMSVAAVLPATSTRRASVKRGADAKAVRDDGEGGGNEDTSLVAESWFFGVFGMWFWMINLNFESLWREAGFTKDELDGTVSGVLEIKALDRLKETSQISYSSGTSHNNINGHAQQHSQRPVPKGRPRERYSNQNGHANGNRSTTPPPLPKSASLPLHTKRGTLPATHEKSLHSNSRSTFSSPRGPPFPQPALQLTPESRSSTVSPVIAPPTALSRSPSDKTLPAIAELERQIEAARKANDDLRSQLGDFKKNSESGRADLREELERQRARKRAEDTAKSELKSRTKALEDQKRSAESARREADKHLKAIRNACDGAEARIKCLEHQMRDLNAQMESQGSEMVKSSLESDALAAELSQQVEEKKREVKLYEEEVAALALKMRELEEKVAEEERRLESANKEAEERREKREKERERTRSQGFVREHSLSLPTKPNLGMWQHPVSPMQMDIVTPTVESMPLERSDVFPSSPAARTAPDSPLSIAPPELLVRRASVSSVLPGPIAVQNRPSNSTLTGNVSSPFPFNQDFAPSLHPSRQLGHNATTTFSPFRDAPLSPGLPALPSPLSPLTESLIPSSLYESLGMPGGGNLSPTSADMDRHLSRSFQSDDDVILDKDWLAKRNWSAGDVGAPVLTSGTAEASPISPSGSAHGDFEPFETRAPIHGRFGSLRMDSQRASFAPRPFVSEFFAPPQVTSDSVAPVEGSPRRSIWFSSKDKDKSKDQKERERDKGTDKIKEKKGLNPDAKEFSLSKDKERSFFASLGRSKGTTTPNSGSGSSSTPSTASSITTPETNLSPFTSNSSVAVSPPSVPAAKTVPSLFGLGSSWFGPSRAFEPTPTEREQLARVLGGSSNASLDRLSNLGGDVASLPNSPQPKVAIAHPIPSVQLSDHGKRHHHFWMTGGQKSTFNPFIDDAELPADGGAKSDKTTSVGREDKASGSGAGSGIA